MSEGNITGKVVMVTGAASGIGRAIAVGFARQGARVLAVDVNTSGLAEIEASDIAVVTADVTSTADIKAAVQATLDRFGRLDVLFNNAGLGWRRRIEELPEGDFEQLIRVHLFGALYGLRAALPVMRGQGYGRIVNTLSRGAEAEAPGWAAYAAAKAGLLALTRVAAAECEGVDILVNGMIPGPTESGMMSGPGLQPPEAVVPSALWLATLPADGPRGKVFWNMKEYRLFERSFG